MTPHQIATVRAGFTAVAPDADGFAHAFYERLFARNPELRALFADADMSDLRGKLVAALAFVVRGLDRPHAILPEIRALALRHVRYGVEADHYAMVGGALLETLAERLGTAFDASARTAWAEAWTLLSVAMITASQDDAAAA